MIRIFLLFVPLIVFAGVNSPVVLTWTASGDDGNIGQASYYDIRYYQDSITELNWDSAIIISSFTPNVAGSPETLTVNLPRGEWYIALKTGDEASNWSEISNVIFQVVGIEEPVAVGWE